MNKIKVSRFLLSSIAIATTAFLFGCDTYVFGVKKEVWDTLNETQKEQVIKDYNVRETEKQKQETEIRKKELETEEKLAPYKVISDVIEQIGNHKDSKKNITQNLTSIDKTFNKLKTSNNEKYSVAFSDANKIRKWRAGEKVIISKNPSQDFYKITIVNLDKNESVNANRDN